jgi:hypothetical protein
VQLQHDLERQLDRARSAADPQEPVHRPEVHRVARIVEIEHAIRPQVQRLLPTRCSTMIHRVAL